MISFWHRIAKKFPIKFNFSLQSFWWHFLSSSVRLDTENQVLFVFSKRVDARVNSRLILRSRRQDKQWKVSMNNHKEVSSKLWQVHSWLNFCLLPSSIVKHRIEAQPQKRRRFYDEWNALRSMTVVEARTEIEKLFNYNLQIFFKGVNDVAKSPN